ncbi:MAG: hypothetical protein WDM96_04625 [Lacunisphaera sp.]
MTVLLPSLTVPFAGSRRRKAELGRGLRACLYEGLVAMPIVTMNLPAGLFLTALMTKGLALPPASIGLLTAMPSVANFLQIFLAPFIHRRSPQLVTVVTAGLQALAWLALVPLLSLTSRATAAGWLPAWFFAASFAGAVSSVAWNAWIDDWVPGRLRGKFFGRRNRLIQVATTAFLLPLGWALSHWHYQGARLPGGHRRGLRLPLFFAAADVADGGAVLPAAGRAGALAARAVRSGAAVELVAPVHRLRRGLAVRRELLRGVLSGIPVRAA